MDDWQTTTIAGIASPLPYALATGPFGSAISAKHFIESGVPVLRGSNLSLNVGARLRDEGLAFLSPEKAKAFQRSIARRGDLVFTCWGTVGQIGLVDGRARYEEYVVSNKQMKLTPDPTKVDSLFLYYLLSSPAMIQTVQGQAIGAAVPGFNLGQLRELQVRIPGLHAQRLIARLLGAFDDLIENNRRRAEVLEEMARAIYREWFVHFRYPLHEDVPLVDSRLGLIPDGWRVARISEICDRIQAGATPRRAEPSFWDEPEVDWYKTGDLTDSVLIQSSERISRVAFTSSAGRSFQPGTILMAIYGSPTVGRLGLIESVSSANQAALGLMADSTLTSTEHLWFVLRELREHLNQIAQGAAQQNVSKQKVEDALTVLPPIHLVRAFTASAGPPWRLSHVLRREAVALAALRDLVLPKLVTGQIDVSSLDLDALVEESVA